MSNRHYAKETFWLIYATLSGCELNKHDVRRAFKQMRKYYQSENKKDRQLCNRQNIATN